MPKFLFLLLTSCAFADTLDGDIEDPDHCCWALSARGIEECLVEFVEPNHCQQLACPSPLPTIIAYRMGDGTVSDLDPERCDDE